MALFATNRFPGDGATTSYNFNFVGGYLSRSHVRAYREDDETGVQTPVPILPTQWLGPYQLGGFTPTPIGQTLVIHRVTPAEPLVDYTDGTRVTAVALDLTHRQGLFLAAEALDRGGSGAGGGGSCDGGGGAPTGAAGGVLAGTYPNPSFAQDMATQAELDVVASAASNHSARSDNPHSTTKAQVGLGNVDNTTDAGKPISTATAAALAGKASTPHTHALTDLAQSGAVYDQVVGWDGAKWAPKTVSFTESGYQRLRVAVVGDSMAAQQVLADSLCWPERWAQMMKACGVAVDVMNLAISGHTFYRANTQAINAMGHTVRDRVVAWEPNLIIVALGANDAILNVDSRTLAQTQADANTFINTVKAALPNAAIVAAREIMYDSVNFPNPGTTLPNKGTFPGVFALKSAGILAGLYTTEVLEDDVGATRRANYANWVSLMATVTGNANVASSFDINAWKIIRLGGVGTDGVHMTAMGQTLLAGYVLKAAQTNATLKNLWLHISTSTFATWSDPDNLFADTLTASGSGWVTKADTFPSDWVSKHPGVATLRPDTWWNRSGAVVRLSHLSYPQNVASPAYWSVARARRNQACQVSINGSAWAGAGGSGVTDENGEALFVSNMAVLPVGSHTMRYRIGDESFGPFILTVTAGEASPLLRVAPATETWNALTHTFEPVKYGNVLANEGGGGWAAGTGLYTVPKAGVYVISHNLGTGGGGSGSNILIAGIMVNGVVQAEGDPVYDTSAYFGSSVSISIRLAAGDTVGFAAYVANTNTGVAGRGWAPTGRGRSCTGSIAYIAP